MTMCVYLRCLVIYGWDHFKIVPFSSQQFDILFLILRKNTNINNDEKDQSFIFRFERR